MRIVLISIFIILSYTHSLGQKVTVSKESSIRNDKAYELLGTLDDRILLYRDQGKRKFIEVYDEELKYLYERDLGLIESRAKVYGLLHQDSLFSLVSGYTKKRKFNLLLNTFDKNASAVDTTWLIRDEEDAKYKDFKLFQSDNEKKSLLLSPMTDELLTLQMVDFSDSIHITWKKELKLDNFDAFTDFLDAFVTDAGGVHLLYYDRKKQGEKSEPQLLLINVDPNGAVTSNQFLIKKKYVIDIKPTFDKKNNSIIVTGLSSDAREYSADSYFFLSHATHLQEELTVVPHRDFDSEFIKEVYGEKLGKKKRLNDFITREVIVRNNGGIILMTEMEKEFYRRSSFNTMNANSNTYGRGWVDIYTEDVILISIDKNGEEEWKQILYKKQFSQDDAGTFSSFFTFKSPSRLRLIYNDAIKNNITVSEYVLDPFGKYERNSLLSTEYQNLKIRWKDAIQISPTQLLVPSENEYKLSIIKVDYQVKS